MKLVKFAAACGICATLLCQTVNATVVMKPTTSPDLEYPSILTGTYDNKITKPESFLGFPVGQKTATPEQINTLVNQWAKQSDKAQIVEYAKTYEGRSLHYLIISSPKNLKNLNNIKTNIAKLSEPDNLSKSEVDKIINNTPATAWMAYSIHGNESSGADASLALIYHLIASDNKEISSLLDDTIVFVDPMMNPDGRARFTKRLQENRGTAPNVDVQSLLHSGMWPFGRTNHYYFDLNRDFYFAVNPESRGRIKAINTWFPQLMIDGHEMGALDTYLFGPPREPLNVHIPSSTRKWGDVFADEQAASYDEKNWPYYTGEWFENLYPGYSNYAEYKGSIHILYEQARTAEDGVRLRNGNIRTYKESVDHQFVSSLANLKTLQKNSKAIYKDFVKNRLTHIASNGQYANKSYVVLPTDNHSRIARLTDILDIQGIEYSVTSAAQTVSKAKNQLGQSLGKTTVPKGSIVINNQQYDAPLIATILEFDAEIKDSVLLEERQKTLRDGSSVMYDTTAWNVTMMYGLDALEVPSKITKNLSKYSPAKVGMSKRDNSIAYIVDGESDASVGFAARLMEQNIQVRVLDKKGIFNGVKFNRGSIVVNKYDNNLDDAALAEIVTKAANDTKTHAISISQGLGKGELPDIGGDHFPLLKKPQMAFVTQSGINSYDLGSMWHMMDTELGIRHSHLSKELFTSMDLRPYNVLVIPSRYYGKLSEANIKQLDNWVNNGGTLIVNGNSAEQIASTEKFSKVAMLKDSFEDTSEYNIALYKEWLATQKSISNAKSVNDHQVPNDLWYPWNNFEDLKPMDKDKLERWNEWTAPFMPSGAMAAARTDQKHWLTFGVNEQLPVLTSDAPLFMAKSGAEAVVRYGVFVENKKAEEQQVGWATIPKGQDLYLRMSGLIWPEAAQRISNAAYLTRERKGNGQIILFANNPNFRGATKGTARLLLNAIVYGPGLGARAPLSL